MVFGELPYKRLSLESIEGYYERMFAVIEDADTPEELESLYALQRELGEAETMITIANIRHDMNVNDAFYKGETDYYNQIYPDRVELSQKLIRKLMASRHAKAWRERIGEFAYELEVNGLKGFDSSISELLQQESALTMRYSEIVSNATVEWEGKQIKRNNVGSILTSTDREIRRRIALAISESWARDKAEIEDIFDKLVKNRDAQAKTMGYGSYVELSYVRMQRIGYNAGDVKKFREYAKRELVAKFVAQEEKRRERLGLDHLFTHDSSISFLSGNPKPIGDTEFCLQATKNMFERLSPETSEFIHALLSQECLDVEIRDGKRDGGYMTFLESIKMPFIYANFDGTTENAYVMTHEGGHAFQGYLKRNEEVPEHRYYTSETAEAHAMSMEFFCWPYMELFFGERAEDYRTMHLEGALSRILYQCEQDEFQEIVYEHPDMNSSERNALWLRLDREYFPARDFGDNLLLAEGCAWQRIPHAFYWPFYAIDYGLAQMIALQYKDWMEKDREGAWKSYLCFCENTGRYSFNELTKLAGLTGLFE